MGYQSPNNDLTNPKGTYFYTNKLQREELRNKKEIQLNIP